MRWRNPSSGWVLRFACALIGGHLAACATVDPQLIRVPDAPPAVLHANGTFVAAACEPDTERNTLRGGMVRSGLSRPHMAAWSRQAAPGEASPIISEAAVLGCRMVPQLAYQARHAAADERLDVWLYAPDAHPLAAKGVLAAGLDLHAESIRRGLNRLGVPAARLVLVAVCSDDAEGDSFSIAGRANGQTLVLHGALASPCRDGTAETATAALSEALDTAFHEGVHVVNYGLLYAGQQRAEVRVADELIASLVGREVAGRPLRLPFAGQAGAGGDGCELPVTANSVFGDVVPSGHYRPPGDETADKRLTEGFGFAMIRAALALGLLQADGAGEIPAAAATAFLDVWGIDLAGVADAISPAVNCAP